MIIIAKINFNLVKSFIGSTKRQKLTVEALGLRKLNHSVEQEATPQVLGMVRKLNHLVKVEEI